MMLIDKPTDKTIKRIENLSDNLPKTKERIEIAFSECSKERRIVQKVKTFVNVPKEYYKDYLDSSIRALNAAKILLKNECFEWVIVPSYSAIYQAGNAVLIKETGKECRDHFCLLISLLKMKKIGMKEAEHATEIKEKLDKLSDEDISFASKLRLVRSSVIYRPSKEYDEKAIAIEVFRRTQDFVNTIGGII